LRLDGKGLGRVFGGMVVVATVKQLIADGWLSPVRYYAPDVGPDLSGARMRGGDYVAEDVAEAMRRSGLVGDAIAHYQRLCNSGSAIVYAATIKHSMETAEQFRAAGVPAQHIDADTPERGRAEAIAALERGELNILSNVNLFTEGLDLPALSGVIMLRSTKSLGLYLQMCGRALRAAPGKEFATIIDHAGNVFEHGLCDEDHLWSLADREPRKKAAEPAAKRCPECGAIVALSVRSCPECGFEFYAGSREPATVAGDLELADPAEILRVRLRAMPQSRQCAWAGVDYERFRLIGELRGYRRGWAFHEHQRALAKQRHKEVRR
jgi:superfamily II DNA or RNA helicase